MTVMVVMTVSVVMMLVVTVGSNGDSVGGDGDNDNGSCDHGSDTCSDDLFKKSLDTNHGSYQTLGASWADGFLTIRLWFET